jgi:hypothetical protein
MKKRRKIRYRPIIVEFWDHCMGAETGLRPIKCTVMGLLVYEDDLYMRIASWVCNNEADNPNNEYFAVLKSAVIRKKLLDRKK